MNEDRNKEDERRRKPEHEAVRTAARYRGDAACDNARDDQQHRQSTDIRTHRNPRDVHQDKLLAEAADKLNQKRSM